ncbi:universal stress protein [Actinomadura sp. WMMB 499]|uniref:universal stress protein n=1 Tax=Actinomadura sp. WMMB 499 TaxID=1219491 RepID=UPI001246F5E1|nr:universal stress protein [Actinomadura sp. WMMB 499]QFG21272.1 universal stress protein [Actinomadura sp. WMMB 499]
MSKRIVVGTDGSECADRAVEWAAREAARRGRPLHIVRAVELWPYSFGAPLFAPGAVDDYMATAGRKAVVDARGRVLDRWPDLEITTAIIADAVPIVLRRESQDAFELVLGSRGLGGFTGLLLGSNGLRMAGHLPIPVVIVRGRDDGEEIVVGVDLLRGMEENLEYAFGAALLHKARLRIVHAWQLPPSMQPTVTALDRDQTRVELGEALAGLVAPYRARHPEVEVVEELRCEQPVAALVEAARNARLLVVGAHRHRRPLPALGAVGHGAVHHAPCPIAVVPSS